MNPTLTKNKSVVLVEDHIMFREQLARLINRELGMTVCAEADNINDALSLIMAEKPDVAIIDLSLKGASGLELVKNVKAVAPEVRMLVLSMHDEQLYAERSLRAGAMGYIRKSEASTELIVAIRAILNDEIYASREVILKILHGVTKGRRFVEVGGVELLADRELEVFELLGRGKSTQEIAIQLQLGFSTVETYRARIKEKLQIGSAAELYLKAGQWVQDMKNHLPDNS